MSNLYSLKLQWLLKLCSKLHSKVCVCVCVCVCMCVCVCTYALQLRTIHTHTHTISTRSYTSITLAQIGLGSPNLYSSVPLHLQQQVLSLMSAMLETVSPTEISQYEEKEDYLWGTFLPYMQFLYKPLTEVNKATTERSEDRDAEDIRTKLHIHCCNVLLHRLESAIGRDCHLQILVKEGLLHYSMCLPAILPQECQPRARSLVTELGKRRQLQPPSLCTLANAQVAKTFCGLQAVLEMHSIGEIVHKCLSM